MAYRTYQRTRVKRRGMQPMATAGTHITPPVSQTVSIPNPVDWGKKCFTWQFKAVLRNTLQDRIGTLENRVFESRQRLQAAERRGPAVSQQETINTTQSRINTMNAALQALDTIPDCEGKGF